MRIAHRGILVLLAALLITTCRTTDDTPRFVTDPKMKETEVDVFPGMDGVTLDPSDPAQRDALRGRIVWNIWVGDSGLMWDYLAQHGFGTADLIKTIDSRRRPHRFAGTGLINQPGFMQAQKPDAYGLFIDEPRPGDPDGAIDSKIDYYTYGRSSGVVGLRISDNPNFDAAAKADWMKHVAADGVNHDYYEKPSYYNNPKLVRPYVVGMACAVCHVSFDPVRPPADPEEPKWSNLNDYVGAQYFKVWEVFVPRAVTGGNGQPVNVAGPDESSFVWQLIHSNPQGTLDTSFIATDYLNNPGTMNGVYNLVPGRVSRGARAVSTKPAGYDPMVEYLTGGSLDLLHVRDTIDRDLVIPRILKQGDDSVGLEGALSRVYVNIGEAWPEWKKHFNPLVGGLGGQSPVEVRKLQQRVAWNWSEARSQYLAQYLITYAKPLLLKDAPGGDRYLTKDAAVLERGKLVFAENCASCHSSKQPPANVDPQSADGKKWFRDHVLDPSFFTDNFLSDERRHRVTEIGTNSTRAAATNATRGHIWDNFSSETYKTLPAVGTFTVDNPYAEGGKSEITIPGGGPGYYRPPSLISLWSSAPYLHNNTVGDDFGDPSVEGRMRAFQDGIERMLFIQPRHGTIWKTSRTSYINIPLQYLPDWLADLVRHHKELVDENDNARIGPIPAGTPINLISNANLDRGWSAFNERRKLVNALLDVLVEVKTQHLDEAQTTELMRQKLVPRFLALNKCADFIEDKGHEFGRELSLDDKRALIELLKTF